MEQPLVVPRIRMCNFQDEIIMSSGFDSGRLIFMTGAQRAAPAPVREYTKCDWPWWVSNDAL